MTGDPDPIDPAVDHLNLQAGVSAELPDLAAPGAFELLEAFTMISDTNLRKAVVRLATAMAGGERAEWEQTAGSDLPYKRC